MGKSLKVCMRAMEERRAVDIVDRKQVFAPLVMQNDLSGVGVDTSIV